MDSGDSLSSALPFALAVLIQILLLPAGIVVNRRIGDHYRTASESLGRSETPAKKGKKGRKKTTRIKSGDGHTIAVSLPDDYAPQSILDWVSWSSDALQIVPLAAMSLLSILIESRDGVSLGPALVATLVLVGSFGAFQFMLSVEPSTYANRRSLLGTPISDVAALVNIAAFALIWLVV